MRLSVIAEVLRDDSGVMAIEYGLIVSLVSVAIILSLTSLGETLNEVYGQVTAQLKKATG